MTGPQDFWDFVDQVDEEVAKIIDDIVEAANDAAQALEDAATSLLETLGRLVPGESDVEKAIQKWNDEIVPAIEQGLVDIQQNVGEAISDFFGDPAALLRHAQTMVAAKATLYRTSTLAQDVTNLGNTWEGDAYSSYATVAGEQSDALLALANNLQAGGELTAAGADKILSVWLGIIRDLHGYSADAVAVVGSFADVGKALGGWISAAADAFALIWGTVGDIALDFAEWWKDQLTDSAIGWAKLEAGFDGMPGNQWPRIAESSSDTINQPAAWPA